MIDVSGLAQRLSLSTSGYPVYPRDNSIDDERLTFHPLLITCILYHTSKTTSTAEATASSNSSGSDTHRIQEYVPSIDIWREKSPSSRLDRGGVNDQSWVPPNLALPPPPPSHLVQVFNVAYHLLDDYPL